MSQIYEPYFATVTSEPRGRWTLIRKFIARWHEIDLSHSRDTAEAAKEIECSLDCQLPESIREWISLANDLNQLNCFEEVFRDQFEVTRICRLGVTTLMLQGEQDVYWAIKDQYLELPDPPVESYWNGDTGRFEFFHRQSPTLTSFALSHLIYFLGRGIVTTKGIDLALAAEMTRSFPVVSQMDNLRIFEMPNLVAFIREMPDDPRSTLVCSFKGDLSTTNAPSCIQNLWRSS